LGPRRELGFRTIFNVLGPLTNPAGARYQLLGVYAPELTEVLAQVLGGLGCRHALVVHGEDGLDEISPSAPTRIAELTDGRVRSYTIRPEDFGFSSCRPEEVQGGTAKENAEIILAVLDGQCGPWRDVVVLNAAGALVAGEMAADFGEGIRLAEEALDSGAAKGKYLELVRVSNEG